MGDLLEVFEKGQGNLIYLGRLNCRHDSIYSNQKIADMEATLTLHEYRKIDK